MFVKNIEVKREYDEVRSALWCNAPTTYYHNNATVNIELIATTLEDLHMLHDIIGKDVSIKLANEEPKINTEYITNDSIKIKLPSVGLKTTTDPRNAIEDLEI